MAKKDGGGKKKKDAEVEAHVDGREADAPGELNGHALEERTGPPALPAVSVEPQALRPVVVERTEPVEPPLAEVHTAPAEPARPAPAAPLVPAAASVTVPAASGWSGADLSDAALVPLQIARSVLPTSRTSVVLGVVALGLVGVLDWPAAVGVGLGWEALRRWGPETPPRGR